MTEAPDWNRIAREADTTPPEGIQLRPADWMSRWVPSVSAQGRATVVFLAVMTLGALEILNGHWRSREHEVLQAHLEGQRVLRRQHYLLSVAALQQCSVPEAKRDTTMLLPLLESFHEGVAPTDRPLAEIAIDLLKRWGVKP